MIERHDASPIAKLSDDLAPENDQVGLPWTQSNVGGGSEPREFVAAGPSSRKWSPPRAFRKCEVKGYSSCQWSLTYRNSSSSATLPALPKAATGRDDIVGRRRKPVDPAHLPEVARFSFATIARIDQVPSISTG